MHLAKLILYMGAGTNVGPVVEMRVRFGLVTIMYSADEDVNNAA